MTDVVEQALEAAFEAPGDEVEVLREEVARLKAARLAERRPALEGAVRTSAFADGFLRRGEAVETKAMATAVDADGGFAVPDELDREIGRQLMALSPLRGLATVVSVGSAGYRKLVATGGTPSGWVSETAGRPETDTPDLQEIAPPFGELYANPAASQTMLDDAAFDVEAWLAGEIAAEFARAEGAAFVNGTGAGQPRGFLAGPISTAGDATRPFGAIQVVHSGAAGGFVNGAAFDKLLDLVAALKSPYRQGAAFLMNSATVTRLRKQKATDGAFLWQPGLAQGQPSTLLGYPVIEAEDMPDLADGSLSVAFGNFRAGYLIAERTETRILRDPYTHKPFVHFYATRRVGGAVMNAEAIKLMKFSV